MTQFRKRPVVIEAVRYMGPGSLDEIKGFIGNTPKADGRSAGFEGDELKIYTLEGTMTVSLGDWIIRGVKGEFYPCKPDIFAATYEAVGSEPADLSLPLTQLQAINLLARLRGEKYDDGAVADVTRALEQLLA